MLVSGAILIKFEASSESASAIKIDNVTLQDMDDTIREDILIEDVSANANKLTLEDTTTGLSANRGQ
jgi:hypothetical protein